LKLRLFKRNFYLKSTSHPDSFELYIKIYTKKFCDANFSLVYF